MMYLFTGLNPRYQLYSWLPEGLHVMYSAGGFWREARRDWHRDGWPRQAGLRWLDSGGYGLIMRHKAFPFSVANYANLVARLRPDFYATMDFPCESDLPRPAGLETNVERIRATVANAKALARLEPMIGAGQMVPVIQGWTLEEYVYCLDLYRKGGLIRPYMAVGTMCSRSDDSELFRVIPSLWEYAHALGVQRLHFFGLKLSDTIAPLGRYMWSRDSATPLFAPTKRVKDRWGGRIWAKTRAQKRQAFFFFWDKADFMELLYRFDQEGVCPECGSFVTAVPCEEFPSWACADCGHEWGERTENGSFDDDSSGVGNFPVDPYWGSAGDHPLYA